MHQEHRRDQPPGQEHDGQVDRCFRSAQTHWLYRSSILGPLSNLVAPVSVLTFGLAAKWMRVSRGGRRATRRSECMHRPVARAVSSATCRLIQAIAVFMPESSMRRGPSHLSTWREGVMGALENGRDTREGGGRGPACLHFARVPITTPGQGLPQFSSCRAIGRRVPFVRWSALQARNCRLRAASCGAWGSRRASVCGRTGDREGRVREWRTGESGLDRGTNGPNSGHQQDGRPATPPTPTTPVHSHPVPITFVMGPCINSPIKSWVIAGYATFTPAAGRWNWTYATLLFLSSWG